MEERFRDMEKVPGSTPGRVTARPRSSAGERLVYTQLVPSSNLGEANKKYNGGSLCRHIAKNKKLIKNT